MSPLFLGLVFSSSTALVVLLGDVIIKHAADQGHTAWSLHVLLGAGLYACAAILWFVSVRHVTLASAGVSFAMISLIALVLAGALWFNEPIKTRDWAGIACALTAMILMMRAA
jgi:undecaprenyl phosphate-alpha-L-ara4N flippase subunit ArnF